MNILGDFQKVLELPEAQELLGALVSRLAIEYTAAETNVQGGNQIVTGGSRLRELVMACRDAKSPLMLKVGFMERMQIVPLANALHKMMLNGGK